MIKEVGLADDFIQTLKRAVAQKDLRYINNFLMRFAYQWIAWVQFSQTKMYVATNDHDDALIYRLQSIIMSLMLKYSLTRIWIIFQNLNCEWQTYFCHGSMKYQISDKIIIIILLEINTPLRVKIKIFLCQYFR